MCNVLIVFAHPEANSFNGQLLTTMERCFRSQGDQVQVSDLYQMAFNPVASASDFKILQDETRLDYFAEQKQAWIAGTLSDDIRGEIDKIAWCDLMVFQFPMYWFSLPAILKGWVDRVFVPGFAFGSGKWYERGGLVGKRAMLSFTMAAYPQMMAADGLNGLLDVHLWHIQSGMLAFCGFDVLAPFVVNGVPYTQPDERRAAIDNLEGRIAGLHQETPRLFHRRGDFDKSWKMKPEVVPQTVGHHFAKFSDEDLAGLIGDFFQPS